MSFRSLFPFVLAVTICFSCVRVYQNQQVSRRVKADRMELAHIKYGLFNVDEWKAVIAGIITKKVGEFNIDANNREELKEEVEGILESLINEVEKVLREENDKRGVKGFFRGMAMDIFDVVDDAKKGVPRYADILIDYLENPANREKLKSYLIERFDEFADATAGSVDYTDHDNILKRFGAEDRFDCFRIMDALQEVLKRERRGWLSLLILAILLLLVSWKVSPGADREHIYALVLICIALLLSGVSLPMIDIEASISSFSFTLVGEPVSFTDQVLFFQSKSILEVVELLLVNGQSPLIFVALLVFGFSVLIPTTKLVWSVITLYRGVPPSSGVGRFLVYKSGKWSMADVMVVAIFMSYIGFNGVINSELTQLDRLSGNIQIFTTNNSTLMVGFYLFTGYCLCGLILSSALDRIGSKPQ